MFRGSMDIVAAPSEAGGDRGCPRVAALIILAGAVRPSELDVLAERSPLDLPVRKDAKLLDHWLGLARGLRGGKQGLAIRVVHSMGMRMTADRPGEEGLSLETDPRDYRGTAGLLRDLVEGYADDDRVIVCPARRILTADLAQLAGMLGDEDFTLFADGDEDIGLKAVRVRAIRRARDVGYDDFREQFLPRMGGNATVAVRRLAGAHSQPIRRASDYLTGLRMLHGGSGRAESWRSTFSIVEAGAEMGEGARAMDSVVLAGAKVGAGAILGRCIVGPGAVVPAGARVVDEIIRGREARRELGREVEREELRS